MPNYTYHDKDTKKTWTEFMSISERDAFMRDNPAVTQVPGNTIPILDSVRLGITKPPSDFQKHVLGRIKSNVPGNNIGEQRFSIPREF